MENKYAQRIQALRALMEARGWDAVIITGSDPHDSEYPAERWKQVCWLTGFTGEAADVVVTLDHAGLWTDTRYFIQATAQLAGTGVELHKTRIPEQVLIPEWLSEHFGTQAVIAFDSLCTSRVFIDEISTPGIETAGVPDLLDILWEDRPAVPQTPVFLIESGESREDKISRIREAAGSKGCDAVLLTSLDDIAWTLNARASDIDYNPLVISNLLISRERTMWFVIKGEVEDEDSALSFSTLESEGIEILPYSDLPLYLEEFNRILADSSRMNYAVSQVVGSRLLDEPCPVPLWKSIKNGYELEGIRKAHLSDGVAMEKFLFWLEKSLAADKRISEWDAAVKLEQIRSDNEAYRGGSFETISAYGKGAALPHYTTPSENPPFLEAEGLYLCDSGGQYYREGGECGTTDITRTVPLGPCTELEREDYTLVLKGHIALETAVFPSDTSGSQLDALARMPLWRFRRNFGHGTGHGVGFFLGCHEGPCEIRHNSREQVLVPGMILSDEPGIYREGLHGVRHENLLVVEEDEENEFGIFLKFSSLTLCHFDTSAIEKELLSKDEIEWLNAYNARVYETLSPLLPEEVAAWLEIKTAAI